MSYSEHTKVLSPGGQVTGTHQLVQQPQGDPINTILTKDERSSYEMLRRTHLNRLLEKYNVPHDPNAPAQELRQICENRQLPPEVITGVGIANIRRIRELQAQGKEIPPELLQESQPNTPFGPIPIEYLENIAINPQNQAQVELAKEAAGMATPPPQTATKEEIAAMNQQAGYTPPPEEAESEVVEDNDPVDVEAVEEESEEEAASESPYSDLHISQLRKIYGQLREKGVFETGIPRTDSKADIVKRLVEVDPDGDYITTGGEQASEEDS